MTHKKYTFYNIKDEYFQIVEINGISEFPKNFADSLAMSLGPFHSICPASTNNTKTSFTNKIFSYEK
jgi:hypothetical protein